MSGKVMWCDAAHNRGFPTSSSRTRKSCYRQAADDYLPWEKTGYTGCFIDEAHVARSPVGRVFAGFNEMMLASHVRVLATATPLQHTPKVSR